MKTLQRCCSVLLACSTLLAAGCATRDPRDAAWDPQPGQMIFEQLPAWRGAALKVCGGHLPEHQRRPGQTGRC